MYDRMRSQDEGGTVLLGAKAVWRKYFVELSPEIIRLAPEASGVFSSRFGSAFSGEAYGAKGPWSHW